MTAVERREARRNRILNNLDNRLKKITEPDNLDRDSSLLFTTLSNSTYEKADELKELVRDDNTRQKCIPDICELSEDVEWSIASADKEIRQENGISSKFLKQRHLHVALLSLLTYFLFRFNYGYLFYYNALVPVSTFVIAQMAIQQKESNSGLVGMVVGMLGMYGIPTHLLAVIMQVFTFLANLTSSIFMFVFFFLIFTSVFAFEF